jgi:HME family heavy-metal exporter
VIALTAIPVSIFITALVFKYFGLSINTMTLGGLAIAIGGLVDDAVVGVENVLRRLKEDRAKHPTPPAPDRGGRAKPRWKCARPSSTPRSSSCWCSCRCSRCRAWRARLFVPLGIAFIVSTLASLVVSVTVTPVLAFYLLPRMKNLDHGDTKVLAWLKARYRNACRACWPAQAALAGGGCWRWLVAAAAVPFFPTTLPAAVQRRHAADRPAAQPRRHAGRVERAGPPGRGAGQAGARGHARRAGAAAAPSWTNMPKACTSASSTWA